MSQENVELVRRGFETSRRTRELDFELLHPDVVWVLHGTPAGDVTYRGREDVRGWFADQDEAWSDQWWEVQDVRETPERPHRTHTQKTRARVRWVPAAVRDEEHLSLTHGRGPARACGAPVVRQS